MEKKDDTIVEFRKVTKIHKQNEKDIALAQAEMKRATALAEIELQILENEMRLEPTRDKADLLRCNISSKQEMKRKAWIYLALSVFYSAMSAAMSVLGLAQQGSFSALGNAFRGKYGFASLLFMGLQIGIIVYSQSTYCIEKDFFRNYRKIKIAQIAIMCSSIFCNYQFMCEMIGNDGVSTKIICAILSASCDIMSLNFSELATNVRFRIYTHSDDYDMTGGLFTKLYIILFGRLLVAIEEKYNERILEIKKARKKETNTNSDEDDDDDADDDDVGRNNTSKSVLNHDEQGLPGISIFVNKIKHLKPGTQVTRGMLGIDDAYQWAIVREGLKELGLVFCKDKRTYRTEYIVE